MRVGKRFVPPLLADAGDAERCGEAGALGGDAEAVLGFLGRHAKIEKRISTGNLKMGCVGSSSTRSMAAESDIL